MNKELKITIKITKHLNKLLMKRFKNFSYDRANFKKHHEIVTPIDLESNEYITKILLKKFPEYNIISEEADKIERPSSTEAQSKKTWYIDPIDGTTNFAYGFPEFATCIALTNKEKIEVGVIGLPYLNEVYSAKKDGGTFLNGKKIQVSKRPLKKSLLMLCAGHTPDGKKRFRQLFKEHGAKVEHMRLFAAAGIELTAVAAGRADVCILSDTKPWDVLAGALLVREAGGKVTNFNGDEWQLSDKTLVASNGLEHDKIIEWTKLSFQI